MSLPIVPSVQERSCGECDACCVHFDVVAPPHVDTRRGERCQHSRPGAGGCQVYDVRPPVCRNFKCLWLSDGLGSDGDRPDLVGVIFRPVPHAALGTIVEAYETRPGALDHGTRGESLVTEAAQHFGGPVATMSRDGTPGMVLP